MKTVKTAASRFALVLALLLSAGCHLRNSCGGAEPLMGSRGDSCGTCGTLQCDGHEKLSCVPPSVNQGTACAGANGCPGTYQCGGDGRVSCVAPECASDVPPSDGKLCVGLDACPGTYQKDSNGLLSCIVSPRNACGICGGAPVQGVGEACSIADGRSGIGVCNADGLVTCARAVITLSWDDTFDDAYQAGAMLESHHMRGVFYVNSPRFVISGHMTLAQVIDLQARGHEIGGHTLDHPSLPTLSEDQQRLEICNDRTQLLADGIAAENFAYPFGATDTPDPGDTPPTAIAAFCKYNSARGVGNLTPQSSPTDVYAEPYVPQNPFDLRAPQSINSNATLTDMQTRVLKTEVAGGWTIVNMHHICDGCSTIAVSPSILGAFLDWLQPRAEQGTVVVTTRQMVGGTTQAPVSASLPTPGGNLLQNASLESTSSAGTPSCWEQYTTGASDQVTWSAGAPYDGSMAEALSVTNTSGQAGLISHLDFGECAPTLVAGKSYRLSARYVAPDSQPLFTIRYFDSQAGYWYTWKKSASFPSSTSYASAEWTTPVLPGSWLVSVGLMLEAPGHLTVDDFALTENQ